MTGIGPLTLITGYQTPGTIRRIGTTRLAAWLRRRGVYKADALTQAALDLIGLVAELDRQIAAGFAEHHQARVMLSLLGNGPLLGTGSLPPPVAIVGASSSFCVVPSSPARLR